ncbi:hypothetical protein IRJ41_001544 [Triplophysa rosa]|uniref:Uncharacterized protein n=1 Tax=Triplophysa rosa TaxID=992332 RepID=A0A9W7T4Z5_TRIRA|nr:hypothetical protein IRJ41_001544 [Triplophysa rosa]
MANQCHRIAVPARQTSNPAPSVTSRVLQPRSDARRVCQRATKKHKVKSPTPHCDRSLLWINIPGRASLLHTQGRTKWKTANV